MAERKHMTLQEFQDAVRAQGVPREHVASKCPICGTIQSMDDLAKAGADPERYFGFSCVGRFTGAGAHRRGTPGGRGCDWTLGGLLRVHTLEVRTPDGQSHPHFELATPQEAQEHMRRAQVAAGGEAG